MAAQDPREIVVGPLTIYLAAAVEAEDDIDGTPTGNWGALGASGDRNYTEDGITVTHSQTTRETRVAGATGAVKVNRTEEALMIALTLLDMSLAQLTKLFNNTTKSTDTTPNIDFLGVRRGPDVTLFSLIAKGLGMSPSGALPIQLYVPRCYQSADAMTPVFGKNGEAGFLAEFSALEHASAGTAEQRFGRWVVQTS